jgi:Methyltransferase domain
LSADLLYSNASLSRPKKYVPSGWTQHAPFGFWIIDALRPRILVELGTYYGFSYLAFLQAIKELGVSCSCFAVDTWRGDEHAGFYQDSVLQQLRQEHDPLYADFSKLVQCTFDEALDRFENNSVDLLHIDGRHFYEDVKHDFETWRPKLSHRSVVLFHDTHEYARGFGVHQLWEELGPQFPSFEFTHGHGLGVLGVGPNLPDAVRELFSAQQDPHRAALVRDLYQRLGEAVAQEGEQAATVSALHAESEQLRQEIGQLTQQAGDLRQAASKLASVQVENQQLNIEVQKLRQDLQAADETRLRLEDEVQKIQNRAG